MRIPCMASRHLEVTGSYSRKRQYNQKRMRQTVFKLHENSNEEAV